ncbi:sensor domain-containing diguanylate cyclase [Vibrio alginolyticus]|uniref:sensor domain-containing diguanylate cyclase n=1 Tax=Vibrio alginolyticus TaxID=663 RepID=UPI00375525BB
MEYLGESKWLRDKLNLRQLILLLSIFSMMVTLLNAFYSIYYVQRELTVTNTIESNRVYAEKMARMTDTFIESALSQLEYSALILRSKVRDTDELQQEVDRLRLQTNTFNSVVIVNAKGIIVAVSPQAIQVKGVQLTSESSLQSLKAKSPIVTDPFVSPAGNYLISISHPIFSEQKEYLGYVSGSIYLDKKNMLMSILGQHSYRDGSYLYVVDKNQTLIYHPDRQRVGEVIVNNDAINDVIQGNKGGKAIINSKGIDMLTGYAPVNASGWGIVAQKSEGLTFSVLNDQMWDVLVETFPIGAITLLVIWISAAFISKPLWQLANVVKSFENRTSAIRDLNEVKPWYFEASHLKCSFLSAFNIVSNTIDQLHIDTLTDSMTGLLNRRGLDKAIDNLRIQNTPFSVLALDVDYFKKVNDTFGHDAGDALLVSVANIIKAQAREMDIVCRSGGEEFMVFLVKTDIRQAEYVAERIRKAIESNEFDVVGHVTISIGMSQWFAEREPINAILKGADDALYQAKRNGRNRTEVHKVN